MLHHGRSLFITSEEATTPRAARVCMSISQEELRANALDLLDFPAIRQRVAENASFFASRELALQLRPSYDALEVQRLQQETAEGITFLSEHGDVSMRATEDPSQAIARAALEGSLNGLELLAVADLLEVLRHARSALTRTPALTPTLSAMAEGIPDFGEIQRRIRRSIGGRGEVLDSATPSLGPLRSQVRDAYQRVAAALDGIVQSPASRESLQDNVISIRGDRLVVQVKTEMRHRVPGIVHDASNTGATLFVEPFATVDLGNEWRELALEEEREAAKALRDLSALVGAVADDLNEGLRLAAQLDLILARARYGARLGGSFLSRAQGELLDGNAPTARLIKARHPLLGDQAVPINIGIGPDWSVLVITGPNTGGKTVAMKTLGLLAIMHQAGLHIPADEGSFLTVFDGIYADVGDKQSVQDSVSTFGSHMRNVSDILGHAGARSLVLLDELGTSTDPEEGSALAKAVLGHLAASRVPTAATTHYRTVAAHAEATPGMMNASVDLDPTTLRPTYLMTLGMPGRSYAMSVAASLGLPADIMESAQSLLEPQYLRFEDWLNELQGERHQLQVRLEEAERARADTEAARHEARAQLADLELRREDILRAIRSELSEQFDGIRKKLRRAEGALSWSAPPGEAVEEARAALSEVTRETRKLETREAARPRAPEPQPLSAGDTVEVRGLHVRGTIVEMPARGTEAEVAIGKVRLHLDLSRLTRVDDEPEPGPAQVSIDLGPALPTVELDLRGYRADEALIKVEEFLDKALRDGLSSVRIIHGRGTGALRNAVRELLRRHPLARSFAAESRERGGDGATIVDLT